MAKVTADLQPDDAPEVQVKQIKSLADLPGREMTVNIQLDDGILSFPARRLSHRRFNEIGRMLTDPEPPARGVDKNYRPVYNTQDPEYQRKLSEVQDKRLYLRLAEFLLIEMPGDTLEAKAEAVADMEIGLIRALGSAMTQTMLEGKATVSARAATFQPDGLGDSPDMPA